MRQFANSLNERFHQEDEASMPKRLHVNNC